MLSKLSSFQFVNFTHTSNFFRFSLICSKLESVVHSFEEKLHHNTTHSPRILETACCTT